MKPKVDLMVPLSIHDDEGDHHTGAIAGNEHLVIFILAAFRFALNAKDDKEKMDQLRTIAQDEYSRYKMRPDQPRNLMEEVTKQ